MRTSKYGFDLFLIAYLVMITGSLYGVFSYGSIESGMFTQKSGDYLSYQIVWLVLYLVLLFQILNKWNLVTPMLLTSGLLLAFLASAIVSYINIPPSITTVVKFGMYLMTIAFAIWLTTLNSADRVFDAFLKMSVFVLFLHFLLFPLLSSAIVFDILERVSVLQLPTYGGLFGHKNIAGEFFGYSILVCGMKAFGPKTKNKSIYVVLIILNLIALLLTNAVGSLLSLLTTITVIIGFHFTIKRRTELAILYWGVVGLVALVVAAIGISDILALFGRDTALTGRDFLLSVWPLFFFEHPFLGYGYAGFFTDDNNAPALQLLSMSEDYARYVNFESSYLEVGIQLGLFGGVLFVLILARGFVTAFQFAGNTASMYKYGPLVFLIYAMTSSVTQPNLLMFNVLPVTIVFWTYFGIETSFARRQQKG